MIIGIGLDIIEIERFKNWHKKSHNQLLRIFTAQEIEYCLSNKLKSSERFAVRFSAKEAFYKAAYNSFTKKISFIAMCPHIEIISSKNGLLIEYNKLEKYLPTNLNIKLSMTHSNAHAGAVIIIELPEKLLEKGHQ